MTKLQELIKAGKIGDVKYISAHIGFPAKSMLGNPKVKSQSRSARTNADPP